MARAHFGHDAGTDRIAEAHVPRGDWRKAISDNIAYALLVYTVLQIFLTMGALKVLAKGSILPYLSLIVLVAAIIPACRKFERHWEDLNDQQARDPSLRPRYRRDQALLWLMAIGLPFVLTALFTAIERIA